MMDVEWEDGAGGGGAGRRLWPAVAQRGHQAAGETPTPLRQRGFGGGYAAYRQAARARGVRRDVRRTHTRSPASHGRQGGGRECGLALQGEYRLGKGMQVWAAGVAEGRLTFKLPLSLGQTAQVMLCNAEPDELRALCEQVGECARVRVWPHCI
jgi:hypothetical protein